MVLKGRETLVKRILLSLVFELIFGFYLFWFWFSKYLFFGVLARLRLEHFLTLRTTSVLDQDAPARQRKTIQKPIQNKSNKSQAHVQRQRYQNVICILDSEMFPRAGRASALLLFCVVSKDFLWRTDFNLMSKRCSGRPPSV